MAILSKNKKLNDKCESFVSVQIEWYFSYILLEKREQREVEPGTFGIETLKKDL